MWHCPAMQTPSFTPTDLNDGFVVAITIEAKPGDEDSVAAILDVMVAPTMAEPGVKLFLPYRSPSNPALFFVYELYLNAAGWAAHETTEHFKRRWPTCCRASLGVSARRSCPHAADTSARSSAPRAAEAQHAAAALAYRPAASSTTRGWRRRNPPRWRRRSLQSMQVRQSGRRTCSRAAMSIPRRCRCRRRRRELQAIAGVAQNLAGQPVLKQGNRQPPGEMVVARARLAHRLVARAGRLRRWPTRWRSGSILRPQRRRRDRRRK